MSQIQSNLAGHDMMDDAQALSLYAMAGDPAAFRTLTHRYQAMVLATCRRVLRSQDDAEDAAQETFLKLARNAATIRGNAAAWLHACAIGTATDLLRRKGAQARVERAAGAANEHASEDTRTWNELESMLDATLAELPEEDRDALIAHFLVGRSQKDIAREAKVSAGTMSRRIEKSLDILASKLSQSGLAIAGTAGLVAALGVGAKSAVATPALTASLAKVALVETVMAGKRATAASFLSGKAAVVATVVATAVVGTTGYIAMSGPSTSGPIAANTIALAATGAADDAEYKSVSRPTERGPKLPMLLSTVDGEPIDVSRLVIDEKQLLFEGAPDGDDGDRQFVLMTRNVEKDVKPAKPGAEGKLDLTIKTYKAQRDPNLPDPTGANAVVTYTIRDGTLRAVLEIAGTPNNAGGELVWRREEKEGQPQVINDADPITCRWIQIPTWWSLYFDKDVIVFGGGDDMVAQRYRIISWEEADGYSKAQTICVDNITNVDAIGKRIKLLVRKTKTGYQVARHEFGSKNLNEWPTFEPKKGDQVRIVNFVEKLP